MSRASRYSFRVERTLSLRFEEQVLAEKGHFLFAVLFVEFDDFLEGMHRRGVAELRQVAFQVSLEFVQEHLVFRVAELIEGSDVRGIHDRRTLALQLIDGIVHQLIHSFVEAAKLPHHAQPRAA